VAKRSKHFESALRWLRRTFPVDCRVVVKVVARREVHSDSDADGRCHYLKKSFRILIADDLSEEMKVVTLDHEWAHVLAFPKQNKVHHTRDWQLACGAIAAAREKRLGNP
jgi:Zn-dependent peptidase ImmA (M78 family)